jgi:hypothetical protein
LGAVGDGAVDFAVGDFAFEGFAFVELGFAFADGEFDLGAAAGVEVDAQGHEGGAFGLELAGEAVDLFFVQEQAARAERVHIESVAELVGGDVGVVQPALAS